MATAAAARLASALTPNEGTKSEAVIVSPLTRTTMRTRIEPLRENSTHAPNPNAIERRLSIAAMWPTSRTIAANWIHSTKVPALKATFSNG